MCNTYLLTYLLTYKVLKDELGLWFRYGVRFL